ncbi:hypothetical protein [Micromonospora sp. NPDC051141]|uniref:hypothetical protein n=1 Tax=Micromonospora sp. NPDC051141 TaxID=3364284 RepID=UPI0037A7523D
MRRGARRVTTAVVATMVALTVAQPARADTLDKLEEYGKYAGYAKTAYDVYKTLLGNEMTLEQAVNELQASIAQVGEQVAEVLDEIGEIAAADVETCTRNAVITFADLEALSPDNAQAFAVQATDCVAKARAYINVVDNRAAVDVMGFAVNTVGPIALFARANAGFSTNLLKDELVAANQRNMERLEPTCGATPLWGDRPVDPNPQPVEVQLRCTAFNHDGYDVVTTQLRRGDPLPAFDYSKARDRAVEVSSYPTSRAVLASLRGPGPANGSSIAAAAGGDGLVRLCGASIHDSVHCRAQQQPGSATWNAWSQLDGQLRSMAVEKNDDGRLELFGVNKEGTLWHRWQTTSGWSAWASLGGPFTSVAVARNGAGRLELFATNQDSQVSHRWQNTRNTTSDWSNWSTLGMTARFVAAEANGDGRVEVFALNAAGEVWHRWQMLPSGWSNWDRLDGTLKTVAVARNAQQRLEIFGTNAQGMLWTRAQRADGNGWSSWSQLNGTYYGVAAGSNADGRVELFAVDAAGKVSSNHQTASGWSGWAALDNGLKIRP